MSSRNLVVHTLCLVLLLSSAAHAASTETQERAAKKACLTGDAAKGVDILAELYLDTGDVNYLFNQGRCFEQNHRYEDAISRFREYLTKGEHLPRKERAEAEKHIADCTAYLKSAVELQPATVAVPPTPAPPVSPADARQMVPAATEPPAPPAALQETQPAPPSRAGATLRVAGLGLAGFGAASLVAAVILNVKVNSMSSDLEDLYSSKTDSTRRTYKTLGWVGYGVGAASLATGAALYYLGWSRKRAASSGLALLPVASPDMAGAVLSGAF